MAARGRDDHSMVVITQLPLHHATPEASRHATLGAVRESQSLHRLSQSLPGQAKFSRGRRSSPPVSRQGAGDGRPFDVGRAFDAMAATDTHSRQTTRTERGRHGARSRGRVPARSREERPWRSGAHEHCRARSAGRAGRSRLDPGPHACRSGWQAHATTRAPAAGRPRCDRAGAAPEAARRRGGTAGPRETTRVEQPLRAAGSSQPPLAHPQTAARSRRRVALPVPASTRSSLACARGDNSLTSSRNKLPPWASSNEPGARAYGAGEGAAGVAEQLSLDEVVGERRAVHGDEPAVSPRAQPMERARDKLLAGATLTFDEHGKRRHGRSGHGLTERDNRRAATEDFGRQRRARAHRSHQVDAGAKGRTTERRPRVGSFDQYSRVARRVREPR